ncbi:hypothetical protein IC235_11480 [Hymenobacter sp. BT664]|uniref:Uncharacterized protein n=1 Tax=Hymenobacter montanus TaxID=2771359 RepID=A0A927BEB1_9BACT|nr:hypothetical protein [Hymenobacter montanus]MBD2768509.1 hypothetical protein [Hymenobacter montanus]
MRTPLLLSFALFSLTFFSCQRHKCEDPQPQPKCYSGVVVGDLCMDGVIINVDAAYPIGLPADTLGNNLIAAVNTDDLASFNQVGKRIYFTYRNDPSQQWPLRVCLANTIPLPVPHLVLSNLSETGCRSNSR